MAFITSHPGPFAMLGLLIATALVLFMAAYVVRRSLPPQHPVRVRFEALVRFIRDEPERAGKIFQYVAFGILVTFFVAITVICS